MVIKIVPTGLTDYNSNYLHEIIEDYLYQNWSETDLPPRSQIKFNYKMDQNVVTGAKSALKCEDAGTLDNDSMYNNDTAWREVHGIDIWLESRAISNFAQDAPIELFQMKNKIRDIISRDRLALRNVGVQLMTFYDTDRVEQDEIATYIFRMKVQLRLTQFMERIEV